MALKITLKPNEKMILGGTVVVNGSSMSSDLIIEYKVPILRQKDILSEKDANSPSKRIYFAIQLMYIDDEHRDIHQNIYLQLAKELVQAAPSATGLIDKISEYILSDKYYPALKLAKNLIAYEEEALSCVQ
ncbi:MAG: flagellar biosynthesis repressor FlbT [Desulfobacterales bacterium]